MSYAYLEFLNFSLTKLNEIYPKGEQISSLASMYKEKTGIWIDRNKQQHFEELYKNMHFQQVETTCNYKINPETKDIVDRYGSFSEYIKTSAKEILKKRQEERELKMLQTQNLTLQNRLIELQTKQQKRYILYSSISFIIGIIAANWKEILLFLQSAFQEYRK